MGRAMNRKRWIVVACALLIGLELTGTALAQSGNTSSGGKASPKGKQSLQGFIRMAEKSRQKLSQVKDYTAEFIKIEVVRGRRFPHSMLMKFREKPFSVYLYYTKRHKGRQVLYVAGQNKGKLLAKESGLAAILGTLALDPNGSRAMAEGRFPISQIGLKYLVSAVIDQWKGELKSPDIKMTYFPDASLKSKDKRLRPVDCVVLESRHTRRTKGIEYGMTRLYIDKKTGLPVRVEQYGFPRKPGEKPPLLAEYTYWNMKTNVGLKDIAFSRKNPRYRF